MSRRRSSDWPFVPAMLAALIAGCVVVTLVRAGCARAASIQFTTPVNDVLGGPAGVKRVNAWFINCEPGHTRYNSWLLVWGARGADGQAMQMRVTPYVCAPGDSCGARVSCADASNNWARDTTIYFRVQ